jgi:hypothetical protein
MSRGLKTKVFFTSIIYVVKLYFVFEAQLVALDGNTCCVSVNYNSVSGGFTLVPHHMDMTTSLSPA